MASVDAIVVRTQELVATVRAQIHGVGSLPQLEAYKASVMGQGGLLGACTQELSGLAAADKPIAGRAVNTAKTELLALFDSAAQALQAALWREEAGGAVEASLGTSLDLPGSLHPITQVTERLLDIFQRMGFSVVQGAEVESEFTCFDALNTPANHPARDPQDSYYFPRGIQSEGLSIRGAERILLRPHTSAVQIRAMLGQKPPLRLVSPGRCFRRDTADATHATNFHQLEGLVVEEGISLADLKGTLDAAFRELMGAETQIRFRPHFFPFTEPSFEVDFSSQHLEKLGQQWVEIMGCGMVHPEVFRAVGYDPDRVSGFAFGMGIERIAMILHGVDDIRHFYQNDLRFLRQFN